MSTEATTATKVPPIGIGMEMLPLAALVVSRTAVQAKRRQHLDKDELAKLTESVRAQGVLQPVLVRPAGVGRRTATEEPRPLYELVAGERRFLAAQAAGLMELPAFIRELSDDQVLEAQLVENLQRADVHPLDEAIGYRELMARKLYDVEGLAAKVGKSVSYIYQRLKLNDLVPKAQALFYAGRMQAGHAVLIARLQPKDQETALARYWARRDDHTPSVRDLADWILRELHLDLSRAPFDPEDPDLLPAAGSCLACPKRTGTQPSLFPDIKSKDMCTDRACYRAKRVAHVDRIAAAEEAEHGGKPLVRIATTWLYYGDKAEPGVVYRDHAGGGGYRLIEPDGCPHAERAIVALAGNPSDRPKVGTVVSICRKKGCRKGEPHAQRSGTGGAPDREATTKRREERARQEAKEAAAKQSRVAIAAAVLEKVPHPLGLHELRALAHYIFDEIGYDDVGVYVARQHGWGAEKSRTTDGADNFQVDDDAASRAIDAMDARALGRFLVECMLARAAQGFFGFGAGRERDPNTALAAWAKHYRLDAKAIAKQVAAELKATKQAAGKQKAAGKKAAGKKAAMPTATPLPARRGGAT